MTRPPLPTDLEQFQSLLQGRLSPELVHFDAGQVLPCRTGPDFCLVFGQRGLLIAQQTIGGRWIDAGLLGPCGTWVLAGAQSQPCQMRALRPGWAHQATFSVEDVLVCSERLLSLQLRQQQQVAQWAYCRQNHALPQRLATWLSLLQGDAGVWVWLHWCDALNLQPQFLQAALQALARSGSVRLAGDKVEVLDAAMLECQACSCLPSWRCAETAI